MNWIALVYGAIFLAAIVVLLFCYRRSAWLGTFVSIGLVAAILGWQIPAIEERTWENHSFWVVSLHTLAQAVVPVAMVTLIGFGASRLKNPFVACVVALLGAAAATAALPWISIYLLCKSGIDCI